METKDPIELLRECLKYEHGFDLLREKLGIELKSGWHYACLDRLADEIDAKYMKLPVDADGVPIRPGDEMQMALGESAEVEAVDAARWFFDQSCLADDDGEYDYEWAANSRHVQPETVEGIIAEAMSFACEPEAPYSINSKHVKQFAERIRKAVEQWQH